MHLCASCDLPPYRDGWLDGLQLEEDFASFFWTHCSYLILGHPQKQFTSQHPKSVHSAACEKDQKAWIGDIVSDKHKADSSCHLVRLTFWRSLCTPARLWPGLTWSSCPEWDLLRRCVWVAVEDSRGVKRLRWPSRGVGNTAKHTGDSTPGPLLLGDSRTFCGTLPSSPRLLRTSHHCLDFWITCRVQNKKVKP